MGYSSCSKQLVWLSVEKAVTDCGKSGNHKEGLLAWEASATIPPTRALSLEHKSRSLAIVRTWDSASQPGVPSAGLCSWLALPQISRICYTSDLFLRALQPREAQNTSFTISLLH